MVAPRASPEDGLLDFFLAKRMRVSRIARLLPGILRGIPVKGEEVVQVQVTGVRILAYGEDELSFELDGELMPMRTPFLEIRVVPASLQILELPGGAAR